MCSLSQLSTLTYDVGAVNLGFQKPLPFGRDGGSRQTMSAITSSTPKPDPPFNSQRSHSTPDHDGESGRGEQEHGLKRTDLARIAFVGLGALAVWLRAWEPLPRVSIIGVVVALIGGWPILKEAIENLRQRRMTMELSMIIALTAALFIGEFLTALVII